MWERIVLLGNHTLILTVMFIAAQPCFQSFCLTRSKYLLQKCPSASEIGKEIIVSMRRSEQIWGGLNPGFELWGWITGGAGEYQHQEPGCAPLDPPIFFKSGTRALPTLKTNRILCTTTPSGRFELCQAEVEVVAVAAAVVDRGSSRVLARKYSSGEY